MLCTEFRKAVDRMANNDVTKKVPMELICMLILRERDMYGYEMVQEIKARSGELLAFNLASVYVVLRRLEENGYVTARSEMSDPARARLRVYYHLEPGAEAYMEKQMVEYLRTVQGVQNLFRSCEAAYADQKKA